MKKVHFSTEIVQLSKKFFWTIASRGTSYNCESVNKTS
jgi:hypothetical protein